MFGLRPRVQQIPLLEHLIEVEPRAVALEERTGGGSRARRRGLASADEARRRTAVQSARR
jgi:hypothetical protein